METSGITNEVDTEIAAISAVHAALKSLDSEAQKRVVDYVVGKLRIERTRTPVTVESTSTVDEWARNSVPPQETQGGDNGAVDGISPVATKWMRRNNFTASALAKVFSVGEDEVDLIAKSVPGKSKKTKMRSVILLKGIAAYLGSGAARITHQQIKEVSLHYDAYDGPNFATYLKDFAAEVSGTKEAGYTLTPRGLSAATEMVEQLIHHDRSLE